MPPNSRQSHSQEIAPSAIPCTLLSARRVIKYTPSSEEGGEPGQFLRPRARLVDFGPAFQAPLFRLDGILGRVYSLILSTRLIDAERVLSDKETRRTRS